MVMILNYSNFIDWILNNNIAYKHVIYTIIMLIEKYLTNFILHIIEY